MNMPFQTERLCISILIVILFTITPSTVFAIDVGFEMEVQERIHSNQIAAARENYGICSRPEIGSWESLARQYMSHGMKKEAEQTYYRAIGDCIDSKKIYHPDTIATIESLSYFYLYHADNDNLQNLNKEVLSQSMEQLEAHDIRLLPVLDYLHRYYLKTENWEKDGEILLAGLEIVELSNQTTKLDIATRQTLLADNYLVLNRLTEAENLYDKSTPIIFAETAEFDPEVIDIRYRMIQLYFKQNNWAKAEPHMLKVVSYMQEKIGEENPTYHEMLAQLTLIYANQSKFNEAHKTLDKALALTNNPEFSNKLLQLQTELNKYSQ